jgi:sulfopyruvate decarboxylase subunit beta
MVSSAAEKIVDALRTAGVDFFGLFPCEKVRQLYGVIAKDFKHVTLSREEEGVGICAGASLAGAKPAMLVQSSGIGNMINALCSLTKVYQFPLPILVSWRGVYKEKIPAQVPMGKSLSKLLRALLIKYIIVRRKKDFDQIANALTDAYARNAIHAILLSPAIWEDKTGASQNGGNTANQSEPQTATAKGSHNSYPVLTRFEVLRTVAPYLEKKVVVCNLGVPCKELYSLKHQKSNFYMLGSMGLASSIGLGISLFTSKQVVVIDGDGSLLTNLGALSTIATAKPKNLTILAIDNGVHGSTGNQPTATRLCVDLEATARGLGFKRTYKAASQEEILSTIKSLGDGPSFVHILAKPGNAEVADMPLSPLQIKENVMRVLKE